MKKSDLNRKVTVRIIDTHDALQMLWDSITAQGQRKKALKDENVRAMLTFYKVDTGDL